VNNSSRFTPPGMLGQAWVVVDSAFGQEYFAELVS